MYFKTKLCSHNPSPIYVIDNIIYYASDIVNIDKFDGDLILNLSCYEILSPDITEVYFLWPDFGLPQIDKKFWKRFHELNKKCKNKKVCVHCIGGHGRTGTALAALTIANADVTAKQAINLIRLYHCEKSIETSGQERYLLELERYFKNDY